MNPKINQFYYSWKVITLFYTLITSVFIPLKGADKNGSDTTRLLANTSVLMTSSGNYTEDSLTKMIGVNPSLKQIINQQLEQFPNKSKEIVSLNHLGVHYFEQSKFDKSKAIFKDLLLRSEEARDWPEMSNAYNLLGVMAELNNQFVEMYFLNKKLMELGKKYDPKLIATAHLNFGVFYSKVNDCKAAKERFKMGLTIYENLPKIRNEYGWLLHRLGEVYNITGDYEKAELYLSKAMAYWGKTVNKRGKRFTNIKLAEVYLNFGKIEKARTTYQNVMQNCIKDNDDLCQIITYISLAKLEYKSKNFQTALHHLEKALDLKVKMVGTYKLKEIYKLLTKIYQALGNFKESNKHYEHYLAEVEKEEQEKKINAKKMIKNKNELQDKEAAYQLLKQSEEINQRKLNNQKNLIIKILLLTFFIGWIAYNSFQTNKRINAQKEALHQLNIKTQEQADKLKIANEQISNQKKEVDLELVKKMLLLSQQVKAIDNLKSLIEEVPLSNASTQMKKIIRESENNSIWDELNIQLTQSNNEFFAKLSKQFTNLSQTELRLCALLRMNLRTKEIANLTFKNPQSVKVARSRLRKKLGLTHSNVDISAFLNQI